jgi:protein CpxP
MKRFSLSRAAAVMAVLTVPAVALPATVFAQAVPASAAAASPAHNVEAHIQALHDQLQITPAEEPQWATFAQVMRNNAAQMGQAFAARGANLGTMNAVADMQSYAQIAQIQSENMLKLAVSFQGLYNSFPADQQKLADGVFREKIASHPKPGMKSAQP